MMSKIVMVSKCLDCKLLGCQPFTPMLNSHTVWQKCNITLFGCKQTASNTKSSALTCHGEQFLLRNCPHKSQGLACKQCDEMNEAIIGISQQEQGQRRLLFADPFFAVALLTVLGNLSHRCISCNWLISLLSWATF